MKTTEDPNKIYASLKTKNIPEIDFTLGEMNLAATAGVLRRLECIKRNIQNIGFGKSMAGVWDSDIEGAGAEQAFCKYKGIFWGGVVNNFKGADILDNIQIRHTALPDGRLIVRPDDNPEEYFVLVIGRMPRFYIVGFIKGKDAMVEKWKCDPNNLSPAWFIPQHDLKHVNLLDCSQNSAFEICSKKNNKPTNNLVDLLDI